MRSTYFLNSLTNGIKLDKTNVYYLSVHCHQPRLYDTTEFLEFSSSPRPDGYKSSGDWSGKRKDTEIEIKHEVKKERVRELTVWDECTLPLYRQLSWIDSKSKY